MDRDTTSCVTINPIGPFVLKMNVDIDKAPPAAFEVDWMPQHPFDYTEQEIANYLIPPWYLADPTLVFG